MSGEDGPTAGPGAAAAAARERRQEQLRQWGVRASAEQGPGERRARTVRFERAAEFLAACAGGDLDEARLMLRAADPGPGVESDPAASPPARAVLDSTNADGISALHQACIDENLEVVRFLVEQGATVNQADNEGWTPLHVAASCGYLDIARYLLSHGANIAAVNSDGDLPLDLAESDAMEGLLKAEIAQRGVDVEAAKRAEEELLLHDTRCWLNGGAMPEARHPRTGASALHVAAAKGYIEVMRLLLQAGYDPELRDGDGWTPLHAAAHWGVEDACRLLAEHGGGMDSLTHAGQRPCDLADEEVLSLLEELARKQEDLRNQKDASQSRGQESQGPSSSRHRRSSVCRLSSREKISLQDLSKERRPGGAGELSIRDEDEGEEGPTEQLHTELRALNGVSSLPSPGPKSSVLPEEASLSRRFGLQKTGSSGSLGPPERRGAEGASEAGLQRSASSSRLEGTSSQVGGVSWQGLVPALRWRISFPTLLSLQAKEPRLARITPTLSRRVPEPSALSEMAKPPPLESSTPPFRKEPGSPVKLNVPTASAASLADSRDRRRSYQMPVRDEESESQRKARSRLMRQSRRSTQGVTLTDLKEAEKAAGKAPEQEKLSLDPSRRPRVPGVENSEGPAQREAPDGQGQGPQVSREHRKIGKERRGPAEGEEAEPADCSPECSTSDGGPLARRQRSQRDLCLEPEPEPEQPDGGFRKLYAELRKENERLREALTETTLKLAQLKVELERATQRQERFAERPALLELERFERRALERKAAELEEELKALSDLRADNQRLKDENAALIRVISKLSK
uniref:Protein phosphatase 1 regulatory subunit n=1 Tax=Castor canadensis TaxID=51338 RepID=A0A8B7VUA1_CASCN|nr:protein phosphatase 1 regulatory subunit 12C isoform X4 [Castor canadensis]